MQIEEEDQIWNRGSEITAFTAADIDLAASSLGICPLLLLNEGTIDRRWIEIVEIAKKEKREKKNMGTRQSKSLDLESPPIEEVTGCQRSDCRCSRYPQSSRRRPVPIAAVEEGRNLRF